MQRFHRSENRRSPIRLLLSLANPKPETTAIPDYSRNCRPDRANAVRAGAAVAFMRSHCARCVILPRLRLRCSGVTLCDLDPAYVNCSDAAS